LQGFSEGFANRLNVNVGNSVTRCLLSRTASPGRLLRLFFGPPKGCSMRDKTKVAAALSTLVTLASVAGRAKGW